MQKTQQTYLVTGGSGFYGINMIGSSWSGVSASSRSTSRRLITPKPTTRTCVS